MTKNVLIRGLLQIFLVLNFFRNLVFDYSSPFDVVKWRRVNKQFKRITDNRVKRTLYLDVLRLDITQILPRGVAGDGEYCLFVCCLLVLLDPNDSLNSERVP